MTEEGHDETIVDDEDEDDVESKATMNHLDVKSRNSISGTPIYLHESSEKSSLHRNSRSVDGQSSSLINQSSSFPGLS